jgi:ABC-type polysaccharide/polyol phosphate export permease
MSQASLPYYDTALKRYLVRDELLDLWRYRNLILHLVKRNVTSRYKRSLLGIGWTLLDPLMTMLVMALVYSALFKTRIEDFPVFLLVGIIIWTFFSQSTLQAMTELMYSGALIGRVYMPKSVFAVAAVGTGLVNLLLSLIPLSVLIVAAGRPINLSLVVLPYAITMLSIFSLGVGLFMSSYAVFFADLVTIYNFMLRLLMFLSGIFYYLDSLPVHLQWVVRINPIYHLIRLFRDPLFHGIVPRWEIVLYASLWAVFTLVIGFWIFTRRSDRIMYHL